MEDLYLQGCHCAVPIRHRKNQSTSAHYNAATQAPTLVPYHLSTVAIYLRNSGCYRSMIHRTRPDHWSVSSLWPMSGALRKSQKQHPSAGLHCRQQARRMKGDHPSFLPAATTGLQEKIPEKFTSKAFSGSTHLTRCSPSINYYEALWGFTSHTCTPLGA